MGSKSDMESSIDEGSKRKQQDINQSFHQNKEKALQQLLRLTCDIKPELHQNYRG